MMMSCWFIIFHPISITLKNFAENKSGEALYNGVQEDLKPLSPSCMPLMTFSMNTSQEPKPNWSLSQLVESKGTFSNFKAVSFLKWRFLLSSELSKLLQDIGKGSHDNEKCELYYRRYKDSFGQELPDCQFKGNKSKIQSLIRKVHIDADGSVTEVQFDKGSCF